MGMFFACSAISVVKLSLGQTMTTNRKPAGCLVGWLVKLLPGAGGGGGGAEVLPYRRKEYLLTKGERAFLAVLERALPRGGDGVRVMCQIRLADLLYVAKGTEQSQSHRNRIDRKTVDFVICDEQALRPMLVIELDDATHERADRVGRDEFVDRALAAAGLAILHVRAARGYDVETLRRAVGEAMR